MGCAPSNQIAARPHSGGRWRGWWALLTLLLVLAACRPGAELGSDLGGPGDPTATPAPIPAWTPLEPPSWYEPLHERPVVLDIFGDGVRAATFLEGAAGNPLRLSGPSAIAVDRDGNLYVADHTTGTIRRIDAAGAVVTIAGSGRRADDGDGGTALAAGLLDPSWMLVDGAGTVLVSTMNRIRRIDPDGTIATIVGTGQPGFGGDDEQAVLAELNANAGMALDAEGNLFIADRGNNRVRRVSRGGVITTVAGGDIDAPLIDGAAATGGRVEGPIDVAVAPDGTVYVAEFDGHRILRLNSDGTVSVVAGMGAPGFSGDGGPGSAAQINSPRAVEVDVEGNLYFADWKNEAIRRVDARGQIMTVAGLGTGRASGGVPAMIAGMKPALSLALGPGGNLFVLQQGTYTVSLLRAPSLDDPILACRGEAAEIAPRPPLRDDPLAMLLAGAIGPGFAGDEGPLEAAQFLSPESFVIAPDGTIYIADTGNHRIRVVSPDGIVSTLAGTGEPGFSGDGGPAVKAGVSAPKALLLDGAGNLYFADSANFRIRRIDGCGIIETIAGSGQPGSGGDGGLAVAAEFRDTTGLAIDSAGNLFIADPASNRVRVIRTNGTIATFAGNGQAASGRDGGRADETQLDGPSDVVVGPDGRIYIAETRAQKIRVVHTSGLLGTVAGPSYVVPIESVAAEKGEEPAEDQPTGETIPLLTPVALTVDGEGRVYFVELTGGVVTMVIPGATPRVVAGDPAGQAGSGAGALEVAIPAPIALDLDAGGNLYVLNTSGELWQIGNGGGAVAPAQ